MAVGNTFGATALSSYGGFWISLAIVLTPGGFEIVESYATTDASGAATGNSVNAFNDAFGYFLAGWFIFTFILLICTLRSTVAFFMLFFTLDLAFLLLSIGHLKADSSGAAQTASIKAGGYFGMFAAFLAWYNALAGIADDRYVLQLRPLLSHHFQRFTSNSSFYSNSFFVIPVAHFPWSVKGRERRAQKTDRENV